MSVIEKKREIAILMTMGARQVGVMKLFLVQGMLVGVFGTAIGAVAAVLTAIALQHIGFGIPGDVYYITNLPVRVGVGDVVLIGLAALLIVWDFAVFPALRGSRLEPVEGLRDG
jgi:lipoprotein-releasing system permease protein